MKMGLLRMIWRCQKLYFVGRKGLGLIELLIQKLDYWIPRLIISLRSIYLKSAPYLLVFTWRPAQPTPILQEYFASIDAACEFQPHLITACQNPIGKFHTRLKAATYNIFLCHHHPNHSPNQGFHFKLSLDHLSPPALCFATIQTNHGWRTNSITP